MVRLILQSVLKIAFKNFMKTMSNKDDIAVSKKAGNISTEQI